MGGLKGLSRTDAEIRQSEADRKAEEFISAAPMIAPKPTVAPAKSKKSVKPAFKRVHFSLDATIDKDIDKLSLLPRTFRATRSDVVRAGIAALQAMSNAEVVALLAKVSGADEDQ